jgi:two-component system, cell cycle sensor histidine kinase and response regulator CckA
MLADWEELRLQIVQDFAEAYWWVVEVRCSQGVIFGAMGGRFFTEDTSEIDISVGRRTASTEGKPTMNRGPNRTFSVQQKVLRKCYPPSDAHVKTCRLWRPSKLPAMILLLVLLMTGSGIFVQAGAGHAVDPTDERSWVAHKPGTAVQRTLDDIPESELEKVHSHRMAVGANLGVDPESLPLSNLTALLAGILLLSMISITLFLIHRLNEKTAGLRESEERFKTLSEMSPLGMSLTNTHGRFEYVNPAFVNIFGYGLSEVPTGREWCARAYPDSEYRRRVMADWKEDLLRYPEGEIRPRTYEVICKDGRRRTILFRPVTLPSGKQLILYEDITERKQAEESLRESERRMAQIIEFLPDATFAVNLQGKVTAWNHAMESLSGISASEMIGKGDYAYAVPFYGRPRPVLIDLVMEPNEEIAGSYASFCSEGERRVSETYLTDFLGRGPTWFWNTATPLYDPEGRVIGAIESIRDITDRKQQEHELRESEKKFRAVFDGSQDAITLFTKEGKLLDCNPRAVEMYRLEIKKDFANARPEDFAPPFQPDGRKSNDVLRERIEEAIEKKGGFVCFEWLHRRKNGEIFPAEVLLSSYRLGEDIVLQANVRDTTERKNLEAQLRQAQKMEAIGTLAGGIAHDFNNLLQAISGHTQLLLLGKKGKDPDTHELKEIERASGRAAALIRQLLAFSRKVEGERRPIDLNQEIMEIQKVLKRTIPKMIEIEIHLSKDLRTTQADPIQMEQIILNLGSNAADAMPEGGKLMMETQNATLDEEYCRNHLGAVPGEYVLLTVTDRGHGIPRETVQHIFEPFFTTKEIGKGTGLGLASVYGIVKSHSGYITCSSEVGLGTTFHIYLPSIANEGLEHRTPAEKTLPEGGSETILVVDDESSIREFADQLLQRFGYHVLLARSGEEALELYKGRQDDIDLVILDLGMPGIGGYGCLREMLKFDPSARVMIASGYAIDHNRKDVLESGASGYIGKPYQLTDLLTRVRAILDDSGEENPPRPASVASASASNPSPSIEY